MEAKINIVKNRVEENKSQLPFNYILLIQTLREKFISPLSEVFRLYVLLSLLYFTFVSGQYKTEEKSNEITAIPELLN